MTLMQPDTLRSDLEVCSSMQAAAAFSSMLTPPAGCSAACVDASFSEKRTLCNFLDSVIILVSAQTLRSYKAKRGVLSHHQRKLHVQQDML